MKRLAAKKIHRSNRLQKQNGRAGNTPRRDTSSNFVQQAQIFRRQGLVRFPDCEGDFDGVGQILQFLRLLQKLHDSPINSDWLIVAKASEVLQGRLLVVSCVERASSCAARSRFFSRLLLRVVGAPDEGTGFYMPKSHRKAFLL